MVDFSPIRWLGDAVEVLDQRELPWREAWIRCGTADEVANCIRSMALRGAPLIGIAAGYGVALAVRGDGGPARLREAAEAAARTLGAARPTAVNLAWALERMLRVIGAAVTSGRDPATIRRRAESEATAIHEEDVAMNRRLGRHGAELPLEGKQRLQELEVELSKATTRFSQNLLDSTNAFELVITDPAKLAGLPETAREAARENAKSKGLTGWRFTLQQPSYIPLMTYLDDASIRERCYRAYVTRAAQPPWDNRELVAGILELRREQAKLLGYATFADLVLEDRMAKSGDRALSFLEDLKSKTLAAFERENRELNEFRRSLEGPDAPELQPWDVAYYAEKLRRKLYEFDEEALRPYFPAPQVLEGMLSMYSRLFGVRIEERSGMPSWDPKTIYYEIYDRESGQFLGGFYADLHPRENKRDGAWMDTLIIGGERRGRMEPHLGLICGNLTPPVGGKPALLTHNEVETIFHEFGHLLHQCLSRVEIRALAGANVAWDFVELPSQIMENWCWERDALDFFSRHFETGEPIPEELYQRMRRARTFRAANAQMRQLSFGMTDLLLHMRYAPEHDGDVIQYARRILNEFSPAPLPPEHSMLTGFSHLFSNPVGYAAGYYSYKWAEVLDADAFTRFRSEGVFSETVGREFRSKILERGDSEDPADLFRSFMGRDPDPAALLERLGLR